MGIATPYRIKPSITPTSWGPIRFLQWWFVDGKPFKDIGNIKIRTAQGGDDYGSMQEVIYRRYSRVLKTCLFLI